MKNSQIDKLNWPVVIRHQASPELTLLKDRSEWDEVAEESLWLISEGDRVIDYKGMCFDILKKNTKKLNLRESGVIELDDLILYLKQHMQNRGICCVSKLNIPDVSSAFEMIESAEDN